MYRVMDMFKVFKKQNPDTTITYPLFKFVLSQYNKKVSREILQGESFSLGSRMGVIKIKKIERKNFTRPAVDWGETNKLLKQGIRKRVFFTDRFYYRWCWEKKACNIPNKTVYKFSPTKGETGNKMALIKLLKTNEFAQLNFKS
jgi:hypothetical protein